VSQPVRQGYHKEAAYIPTPQGGGFTPSLVTTTRGITFKEVPQSVFVEPQQPSGRDIWLLGRILSRAKLTLGTGYVHVIDDGRFLWRQTRQLEISLTGIGECCEWEMDLPPDRYGPNAKASCDITGAGHSTGNNKIILHWDHLDDQRVGFGQP
jgi:hypothetical protein